MNKPTSITDLGRDYQLDLFNEIIVDAKFGETIIDSLEGRHFNVEAFQKIILIIKKYYKDHETIVTFPALRTQINIEIASEQSALKAQLLDTVQEIEDRKVTNKNVQSWAVKFCKMQNLKLAMTEIDKKIQRGVVDDYDHIEKVLKDALIFKDVEDSITLFHNMENVLSDDYRDPIRTGIEGIDEIMGGGISKGELALVIAPLGVGKSTFLTKVANQAYTDGRNVLQVFFEDKEKDIQRKHYTIMSKVALSELGKDENKNLIKERLLNFKLKMADKPNQIFLQKLPADGVTVSKIKNIIKKINSRGTKIDLLILDYVDCLSLESTPQGTEEWSNEGKIMRLLETMIEEMNVACWTATQGNRASTAVEVVKTDNMGGSLKKAQIAHLIMSIGKTLEQKEAKVATIAILKNRMGPDGMVFESCKFDNSLLEIDTNERITENGFDEKKSKRKIEEANQKYQALLREKSQAGQ